ncbi:lantibiotic dehydratase [Pedobacter miscanthi]|uniref:lantibiotic dehydratase n=1 Tax=Pedobacter miscanthi TaxID=2259170 RepID=UPI00292DD98B|nr:lantibiotic dehydratase [Pedobacter miscanthi]
MYKHFSKLIIRTPLQSLRMYNDELAKSSPQDLFLDGLYLSTPEYYHEYFEKDESQGERKKLTFNKYWIRSVMRSTPFATFAGCGIAEISSGPTSLILDDPKNYHKSVRLDMNYLTTLVEALINDTDVRSQLRFFPNNSIYEVYDEFRYVEYLVLNGIRHHKLSSVEKFDYIKGLLNLAKSGCLISEMSDYLINSVEVERGEAEDFIATLINSQLLVSQLEINITGQDALDYLVDQLKDLSIPIRINEWFRELQKALREPNNGVPHYRNIEAILERNVWGLERPKTTLQSDMFLKFESACVDENIINKIISQIEDLSVIYRDLFVQDLDLFKTSFIDKFGEEEIPLAIAIDADLGIGYSGIDDRSAGGHEFIDGLMIKRGKAKATVELDPINDFVQKKYHEYLRTGATVIEITDDDLNTLRDALKDKLKEMKFSNSMLAMGALMKSDKNDGGFMFDFNFIGGPSGANLISRFAYGSEELMQFANEILNEEEKEFPDCIYAEIVHFPQSFDANILSRPLLRKYEIPYVGISGAPLENQIEVSDIFVSVVNDRVVLRSKRLNKVILPRLTSAHNYSNDCLPLYKFLCDVQDQGLHQQATWRWGKLDFANRLPRVYYKNLILKKAEWVFYDTDFKDKLNDLKYCLDVILKIRAERDIPRFVGYARGDNCMLLDLDSSEGITLLVHFIKRFNIARLTEYLFNEKNCIVNDNHDNPFTNELIIPVYRNVEIPSVLHSTSTDSDEAIQTNFSLGSEWIYFKIYCGSKSAEKLLKSVILSFVEQGIEDNDFEKFFFIRYWDTSNHIRIRFYNSDASKNFDLQSKIIAKINPYIKGGIVSKFQLDTYQREIKRYGASLIEDAESWFYYDSLSTLRLLTLLNGEDKDKFRLLIAIRSVDALLNDFNLLLEEKYSLLEGMHQGFYKEFGSSKGLKIQLNHLNRNLRKDIIAFLEGEPDENLMAIDKVLMVRSLQSRSSIDKIIYECGDLEQLFDLLRSYIHMSLNRLFIGKQRVNELLVYTLMERLYSSKKAMSKNGKRNQQVPS